MKDILEIFDLADEVKATKAELKKSIGKKDIKLINETNSLEEEYKREVNDTLNNDK